MNQTLAPQAVVTDTLKHAALFQARHSLEKGVQQTFGYFTHHPVAPLNKKRLGILLTLLNVRAKELGRPLRILDLACGGGVITCAAAALGHRALGLDLSREEIHFAQRFAQEERLSGVFWQADLLQDPGWEKTVQETLGGKPDVVILAYALHHLPGVEVFVDRLSGWLDSGAQLLVNEENPDSPLFRLKHVVRGWIQKDTETEWHRTYDGWKQVLEQRGFRTTSPIGADILPGLGRVIPMKCWSLVFTAHKS